jgi:hypothetical protein
MNEITTSKGSLNHGAWSKSHGVSFTGTTYKKNTVANAIVAKTGQRNVLRHRSSIGIIPSRQPVILSVSRVKGSRSPVNARDMTVPAIGRDSKT